MRSGDWKIIDRGSRHRAVQPGRGSVRKDDQAGSRQDVVDRLRLEISSWLATLPESYATGRVKSPESPVADAGPNQTIIDDDGDGKVWVKLDASGSSDPDGYLSGYVWLLAGEQVAVSRSPFVRLPLGEHRITLRVTDYAKKTATDQVLVSVVR